MLKDLPLVNEAIKWIEMFDEDERPFDISPKNAWLIIRNIFGAYPHYWRFNYITKGIENAEDVRTILPELLDDTRMDITTVTGYVMASPKHRAAISRRELQALRKKNAEK